MCASVENNQPCVFLAVIWGVWGGNVWHLQPYSSLNVKSGNTHIAKIL